MAVHTSRKRYFEEKEQTKVKYIISLVTIWGMLLLSGCSASLPNLSMTYHGNGCPFVVDAQDYCLIRENDQMMVMERDTDKQYPLLNNPLEPEDASQMVTGVKAYGNNIYFLGYTSDLEPVIRVINLDTGESRELYLEQTKGRKIELFGVTLWEETVGRYDTFYNQLLDFFILNGQIILIRTESFTLYDGKRETPLYEGYFKDVACDGNSIFFTDEEGVLCQLEFPGRNMERFMDIRPSHTIAMDNHVYFLDPQRNNQLMVYDVDAHKASVVMEGEWSSFAVTDHYIWAESQGELYMSDLTGSQCQKLSLPPFDDYAVVNSEQEIAVIQYDPSGTPEISFYPRTGTV